MTQLTAWINNKHLMDKISADDLNDLQNDIIENVFGSIKNMLQIALKDYNGISLEMQQKLFKILLTKHDGTDIYHNHKLTNAGTAQVSHLSNDAMSNIMSFCNNQDLHNLQQTCRLLAVTSQIRSKLRRGRAISKWIQATDWTRYDINRSLFGKLQRTVIPDLCQGNDSIVVAPPGSGKSISVILASMQRLHVRKAPCHILFVAVDHVHVETLHDECIEFRNMYFPKLMIYEQVRGSPHFKESKFQEGQNIFICSPNRAIEICGFARKDLVSVNIFDSDILLVEPSWTGMKSLFKYIPSNININFISNSYCLEVDKTIEQLIDFDSDDTKKHLLTNNYDNLKFWFIYCGQRNLRLPILQELCKVNPYKQGIIYTFSPFQASVIQDGLLSWGYR